MSLEPRQQRSLQVGRRAFVTGLGLAVAGIAVSTETLETPHVDPYAIRFVDLLPPYVPDGKVSGTISLWGHGSFKHDFLGRLLGAWIDGFKGYQAAVQFENRMYGTASAIGALLTGAGNLAIL